MVYQLICHQWGEPNNFLFQLANIFIVFSNFDLKNQYTVLYIRTCLLLSSIFFCLWGWIVLCSLDTFVWNFIFICINIFHVSYISYTFYPFNPTLDSKSESIYQKFDSNGVSSRRNFYHIFWKNIYETQTLETGDIYCAEGLTAANKLSLLISGKIAITRNNTFINEINELTFIDSAQWFVPIKEDQIPVSKVTLMALEKSHIISWNTTQIRNALTSEPVLHALANKAIGEDAIKTFYCNL